MENKVLVFLKPDAVIRKYVGARTLSAILENGFEIERFSNVTAERAFLQEFHYKEHEGKFFFDFLLNYTTTSPLMVLILKREDAVSRMRALLGKTRPENDDFNSIRGRYGIFKGINVAHSSDSDESAKREIKLWSDVLDGANVDKREVNNYIDRYIDFPMVDSLRYREVSISLMRGEISEDFGNRIFSSLVKKETDMDDSFILNLSKILVQNSKT
jgi:nucleoside-diphosphate kinase